MTEEPHQRTSPKKLRRLFYFYIWCCKIYHQRSLENLKKKADMQSIKESITTSQKYEVGELLIFKKVLWVMGIVVSIKQGYTF